MFQRACTPWVKNTIQTKGTASILDVKFYKSLLNIFILGIYTFTLCITANSYTPGELAGIIILQERQTEEKEHAQVLSAEVTKR